MSKPVRSFSVAAGMASTNVSLKVTRSLQFNSGILVIPLPCILVARSIISVKPTKTFLGSQPRLGQVPPYSLLSAIATFHPAFAQSLATPLPEVPVPITNTSKCSNPIIIIYHSKLAIFSCICCYGNGKSGKWMKL